MPDYPPIIPRMGGSMGIIFSIIFVTMTIHPTYDPKNPARLGQLVFLLGMVLIMAGVLAFLVQPVIRLCPLSTTQSLLMTQIFSSLLVFGVPALLVNIYYKMRYMRPFFRPLAPVSGLNVVIGLSIALLAFIPSSVMEDLMRLIPEPDFLVPISDEVARTTELIVSDHTTLGTVLALLALVVAAPIAEELLFRGALQQWVLSVTRSGHAAVWVVAILFALIHVEWLGMLPRAFMGVVLGYSALYGGLKVSVPLHALNNLIVYLLWRFDKTSQWVTGEGLSNSAVYILMALICLGAIGVLIYYMRQRTNKKYHDAIQ